MDFVKALLDKKLLLIGNFMLTSGKVSPYYLDLRKLPNHPDIFSFVVSSAVDIVKGINFDMILGVVTGGVPFASFIACKLNKPMGYIRAEKKGHGTERLLEADVDGKKVIVVDDVATTGGSILKAVEEVRKAGGKVEHALVIVDREEGAFEKLESVGIRLLSVYKVSEILNSLIKSNLVAENEKKLISDYMVKNIGKS
ncbi:orotate phosphoribosyltransferase [Sulfolobus acidocaldarius]|uniref:Orotate phosphoribosyltransferase n=5 Tax=Sulfolobus acidocaldarius TaxID=2285 RepID=PYRE_SULAC|nr:orotate phosphoribosyltransferase [Sulfolobus acidocaldarius]O08359.1 RecName: Full=Orotate phosphoribosyltransferase; Short=OPRT; Short=OPRTase [Sulfolobus acidocaldarius DSM 639]AAY80910.1 orotate phosphoribosyltransferase [Sulfolobus acidocaldarius DSM 639]AGE71510.1 orotate phosphoribosyltransferase [Sulfolobus acidocaldarius N8]AGE73783.1 orotate phosphoribosyltransferase [Sulfolobus acidocaldarius Ron12/I]ALU30258.1 orotate phosphoribosyltransferase [Sulfolobus acidocaldarius]ALU3097